MKYLFAGLSIFIIIYTSKGQTNPLDDMKFTEDVLYASTKQVNQFFHRFNGEEDTKGNRLYDGDKNYRDPNLRKDYLINLFDLQNSNLDAPLVKEFIKEVIDKKNPKYIDLHDKELMAEAMANFVYEGREVQLTLIFKLQRQAKGSEWVFDHVRFPALERTFKMDTTETKDFIHPMSHELDFMNLKKVLENTQHPEQLTPRGFEPDILSIFLFEIKKGRLIFQSITNLKFHYLGLEDWYFEIAQFNRSGYNSGWLISNLVKADKDQKLMLKEFIYD
jgi:hypothetical protein